MRRLTACPSPGTARLSPWWLFALTIAVLLVFAPVRHFDFVSWDDTGYVTSNPHVLGGLTWESLRWAVTTGDGYYWHPLTWISHLLDVEWFGLNGGAHHVTSLLLHLLNSLLLFAWLRAATGDARPSAFVAALFALHPAHVESVAWVAERKDVLSTCFLLLTLLAYAAYTRRPSARRYTTVLLLFALGLAAKPMLVTVPVLLLLVDIWPARRWSRATAQALVVEKLPLLALAAASAAVTFVNQQHAGAVRDLSSFPVSLRVTNAFASLASYLRMLVWPGRLSPFYPYPTTLPVLPALAGLLAVIGVTVLAIRLRRRVPFVLVGWCWFLVSLLPVIGLVQAGDQAMADRFTYVSYIGLFMVVAWTAARLPASGRLGQMPLTVGAVSVLAVLGLLSRGQVMHWRTSEALWSHAAAVTTDNEYAHANLGLLFETQGRLPEATREYREAARIAEGITVTVTPMKAGASRLHNQVGVLLMRQGHLHEAAQEFEAAVKAKPDDAGSYHNLGVAMEGLGHLDEAEAAYRESARLDPRDAESRANLALLLATHGHVDQAIPLYQEAVALEPNHADWHYNLGAMLERSRRQTEAVSHYAAALRIDPHHAAAGQALTELAGIPATR